MTVEQFLHVLNIILPVLLALALGALARKRKLLTREGAAGLKTLVSTFTLPVVLFGAFYNAAYDATILVCALTIFACCIVGLLLGRLASRLLKSRQALLPYLTTGFEMGMMGYALYIMLFGAEHITSMAIVDLGQAVFVFSVYMSLLNARNGMGRKETLHAMLTSPVFLSILAGLLFGITGLGALVAASPAGETLSSVIDFLGTPTGCVILFVVGYEIVLSRESLKEAVIAAFVRLIIMAVLCLVSIFIIGLFAEIDQYLRWALLLMFLLPGPFVLPLFVQEPKEASYASTCLSLYTLLSIGLFAVLASLSSVAIA